MPKLVKIGILIGIAAVLCGFSGEDVASNLGVYRGEPVPFAVGRLGPPSHIGYAEGQRIYFWRATPLYGRMCKVWGAARHAVIVNWGYQSCT